MAVLKRVLGFVLALLPDAVVGRVLPGTYRFRPQEVPAPPALPPEGGALVIAPTNYAGQGFLWARALRERTGASAVSIAVAMPGDFAHEVDSRVPQGVYAASTAWSRSLRAALAARASHVLVEAGRRPFGSVLTESLDDQVRWMLERGLTVGYLAHGSDLRLPSRHAARFADSPFLHGLAAERERWERIVSDNLALIERHALPTLVSTPDLLLDAPDAEWLPVVVDPGAWSTEERVLGRRVPVVVHAPSRGVVKGSELVDEALAPLIEEGLIDYRRISGVPHRQMPSLYREADIVLDQFRIGDYGVAACEALAGGRLVISSVSRESRAAVRAATGSDLPIVEAPAGELDRVLREVLAERERFRSVAQAGPAFVEALHDGRRSVAVLERFLQT